MSSLNFNEYQKQWVEEQLKIQRELGYKEGISMRDKNKAPMQETKQKEIRDWEEKFKNEFGIHFSESEFKFAIDFISTLLAERDAEVRVLVKELRLVKDYDGNNLNSACEKYCIGAENWTEIIRYEDGHNKALDDIINKLDGK